MKINTNKISGKIKVRIMRPWRGYQAGSVISPPAGLRQMLLQSKDHMGRNVAEVVAEVEHVEPVEVVAEVEPVRVQLDRPKKNK